MTYCKDAKKLLSLEIVCGMACPLYGLHGEKCPRLILEDATDAAIDKAMEAMIKLKQKEAINEDGSRPVE